MKVKFFPKACTIEYKGVELMLEQIVNRFVARHGCDRDELIGTARFAYMRAYCTYHPARAKFTTWVWWKVYGSLLDHKKKISRRAKHGRQYSLDATAYVDDGDGDVEGTWADNVVDNHPTFDRDSLIDRLGPDAKVLIRLVLDAPGDLKNAMAGARCNVQSARKSLRAMLLEMGWVAADVRAAFAEIRSTLGWERASVESVLKSVAEEY